MGRARASGGVRMNKTLEFCEVTDIHKLLRPVKEKWEKIGLSLGLAHGKLRQIEANKNGDPVRCLYATIDVWVHKRDAGRYCATWRTLFRALESAEVDEAALAERIKHEKGFQSAKSFLKKATVAAVPHEDQFNDEVKLASQDLSWLLDHLTDVAPNWINFGLSLNVPISQLKIIEENNPRNCVNCLRETLNLWLKNHPSTGKLLKALSAESVGQKQLASALEKRLIHGDHRQETPHTAEENTLERYLRSFYCNSPQLGGTTEWPPTLEVEYINLELISQAKLPTLGHQQKMADLSKRGEIGAALNQSQQLTIQEITDYASSRKVILVEGVPGVGKTTLAYKLCRDWANRKLLKEFWLVLYVPLRVPKMKLAQSADDILNYFGRHCASSADIQSIKINHGRRVLFILDGWDELRPSCRLPNSFFPRLVMAEFLPECSVIITSRPGAVAHAIRTRAVNRVIEILGFTQHQVDQYIQSYFNEYKGIAQRLTADLRTYPNVGSTCYVAINLTILCYVYLVSDFQLPSTLTQVYEQFVTHAIKRHFNRLSQIDDQCKIDLDSLHRIKTMSGFDDSTSKILSGLGRLAMEGLERGDLSFTHNEVAKACGNTDCDFDGFGLLRALFVFRIQGSERNYQFLHLTVQEYLAAYTVLQMKVQEQKVWLEANFTNESCDKVLKFFCGMDRFRSSAAQEIFSKSITTPFSFECVFEGQWDAACKQIAIRTSSMLTITGRSHVQPYRALVYGYVMAMSGTQWHLQWTDCVIGENELKSTSQYLMSSPTTLSQIYLQKVSFASKEAVQLFAKIIQSQEQLVELTLDRVPLDKDAFQCISKALTAHLMLKCVTITQNSLLDINIEEIKDLLNSLPSLEKVDFRGNLFGEDNCIKLLKTAGMSRSLQVLCIPHKSNTLLQEVSLLNATRQGKGLIKLIVQFPH